MIERIAHRGHHDVVPENTLAAFHRALELGFDAVELDVHVTADGVPVVSHDDVVGTPRLTLSIRSTYHATLVTEAPSLPTLDETLSLLGGRAKAYVEIKASDGLREIAAAVMASGCDAAMHAFDHRIVAQLADIAPEVPRGILTSARLLDSAHALRAARATDFWQWHEFVDRALVDEIVAAGGRVIAWTANAPAVWRAFDEIGVAGICTDLAPHSHMHSHAAPARP